MKQYNLIWGDDYIYIITHSIYYMKTNDIVWYSIRKRTYRVFVSSIKVVSFLLVNFIFWKGQLCCMRIFYLIDSHCMKFFYILIIDGNEFPLYDWQRLQLNLAPNLLSLIFLLVPFLVITKPHSSAASWISFDSWLKPILSTPLISGYFLGQK